MEPPSEPVPPVMLSLRRLWDFGRARVFLSAIRIDPYHESEVAAWRRVVARMRPEDHLIWLTYWHADPAYFAAAAAFYADLPLSLDHLWVLGNTREETEAARQAGFRSAWVNHNSWLDENRFRPQDVPKQFRAVLVSQLAPYKRIELAARVPGLALVPASLFHLHRPVDVTTFADMQLIERCTWDAIPGLLNRARTGLILSAEEGACHASSEYLLCGLPVVSTPSVGGRDVFYTPSNSLLVEPTAEAVARGVDEMIRRAPAPWPIHEAHVNLSREFRRRFAREVLGEIFRDQRCEADPEAALAAIYQHKMVEFVDEAQALALVEGTPPSDRNSSAR